MYMYIYIYKSNVCSSFQSAIGVSCATRSDCSPRAGWTRQISPSAPRVRAVRDRETSVVVTCGCFAILKPQSS